VTSRTPLLRSLARLARDHAAAEEVGVPPEAVRERRARRLVTRREVLAAAAAGAALAAMPRFAFARKPKARIAIVGAGMSGLAAALELADRGIASTVYEASGRIGGRMFSNTTGYWDDGQVTEWCGELIDTGHVTIRRLAKRFGLALFDVHAGEPAGSTDTYRFANSWYAAVQADADFAAVRPALRADLRAAGYPTTWRHSHRGGRALDAMTVADWIDSRVPGGRASPFGALLDVAYATEYGAETSDQSALNLVYLLAYQPDRTRFAAFGVSDETSRIAGGNQSLPAAVAQSLPAGTVVFGRSLASIRVTPGGAYELTFDTASGSEVVTTDVVLLTLPFAVLRDLDFALAGFDARKTLAIEELGRGRNGKLQMQFASRLWNGAGAWPSPSNGSTYADTGYQSSWDPSRSQPGTRGILNAYSGGAVTLAQTTTSPFATASDPLVAADTASALSQMEPVFPGLSAQWNAKATQSLPHKSAFFNCSYSYWRVGQYAAFGGYERVRQGGVFFAGEHTSTDFQGFMEGAASEGRRAGRAIARFVRRA
jgi:monoamine oxidase